MGAGACGVGRVGDLVLGLTTQDKGVLIGGVGTLLCSLNDGRAVRLLLVHVSVKGLKGGKREMWRDFLHMFVRMQIEEG